METIKKKNLSTQIRIAPLPVPFPTKKENRPNLDKNQHLQKINTK